MAALEVWVRCKAGILQWLRFVGFAVFEQSADKFGGGFHVIGTVFHLVHPSVHSNVKRLGFPARADQLVLGANRAVNERWNVGECRGCWVCEQPKNGCLSRVAERLNFNAFKLKGFKEVVVWVFNRSEHGFHFCAQSGAGVFAD